MAKRDIVIPDCFLPGTKYMNNQGSAFLIEKYNRAIDIDIRFVEGRYKKKVTAGQIKKGAIQNPFHRVSSGVGYMGVGRFSTMNSPKASQVWRGIIHRCYDKKRAEKFIKNYDGCSVHEDWHNFQNFAEWYEKNYSDGYEVDKDLLFIGNKIYSKKTCILVPQWLNVFTASAKSIRGEFPVGVSKRKGKDDFEAYCNFDGKRMRLGVFSNSESAHRAWMEKKLSIALSKKNEMDDIDERIYPNVVSIIKGMK